MKIAAPTKNNQIDDHFGHCEYYSIFTIDENNAIINTETLASPKGCGCKSNIASLLQDKGVSVMLVGNIGNGALNVLTNHGMKVYRGCKGEVNKIVQDFLDKKIVDSGEVCDHHDDGHVCNH